MKLRITTPETNGEYFIVGRAVSVFLDDVDVSKYTSRVVLTVDADEAISAEVTFWLSDVAVDIPAVVRAALDADE